MRLGGILTGILLFIGLWVVPTDTRAGMRLQRAAVAHRLEQLGFAPAAAAETVRTLDGPRLSRLASRLGNPVAGAGVVAVLGLLVFFSFSALFLLVTL